MQNEFEKQVKQKMEELDFVPSQPVWTKIEEQIREKKQNRRLLFWLPLLVLLAGGSILLFALNGGDSNDTVSNRPAGPVPTFRKDQTNNPQQASENNSHETAIEQIEKGTQTEIKAHEVEGSTAENGTSPESEMETKREGENSVTFHTNGGNKTTVSDGLSKLNIQQANTSKKQTQGPSKTAAEKNESALPEKTPEINEIEMVGSDIKPETQPGIRYERAGRKTQAIQPISRDLPSLNESQIKIFPVKNNSIWDSLVVKNPADPIVKTFGRSRWQFGFTAHAGLSGAGEGLQLYGVEKTRADVNSPGTSNMPPPLLSNRSIEPSPIGSGLSFSAGAVARKQLNKRFAFSAGLQYAFLSNSIKVGSKIPPSFSSGSVTNSLDLYTAAHYRDYINRFHFISLPVALEFQLLKKMPLNLHAGVSLNKLIATNALVFDEASHYYREGGNGFNKSQLFTEWGLSYSLPFRNMAVAIGPQFQFGLTSLENTEPGKHLFAFGLKTRILFQKK